RGGRAFATAMPEPECGGGHYNPNRYCPAESITAFHRYKFLILKRFAECCFLYCSQQGREKNGGIMEHGRDYSEWRLALRGATQLSSVKIVNAPECGKVAARQ
ncbi:TPA: hypothetical protein K7110_001191, partial [Salmonella enterica subsp. enterica serovar Pullorum]|nr:hypothetical protein [Salmonella enterica subsp. enterica]EGH2200593.1 hypothetical protein [Salmonella enterica]HBI4844477.1 hypothetical protein [Salmonella enterica subsp. enterica serovar Pullorum]EGX6757783.1 hypothetical protein [Salmonella enterica]EID9298704.1 hypothetical protein [Salmonella enterica]